MLLNIRPSLVPLLFYLCSGQLSRQWTWACEVCMCFGGQSLVLAGLVVSALLRLDATLLVLFFSSRWQLLVGGVWLFPPTVVSMISFCSVKEFFQGQKSQPLNHMSLAVVRGSPCDQLVFGSFSQLPSRAGELCVSVCLIRTPPKRGSPGMHQMVPNKPNVDICARVSNCPHLPFQRHELIR